MKIVLGIFIGLWLGYMVGAFSSMRSLAPLLAGTYKREMDSKSKLLIELGRKSEVDSLKNNYNIYLDSLKNIWVFKGVKFEN